MEPTWVKITETTLSDGSIAYGLMIGETHLDCVTLNDAYNLANAIEAATVGTQFDGWNVIKRTH